jgi:hypothetical protein
MDQAALVQVYKSLLPLQKKAGQHSNFDCQFNLSHNPNRLTPSRSHRSSRDRSGDSVQGV